MPHVGSLHPGTPGLCSLTGQGSATGPRVLTRAFSWRQGPGAGHTTGLHQGAGGSCHQAAPRSGSRGRGAQRSTTMPGLERWKAVVPCCPPPLALSGFGVRSTERKTFHGATAGALARPGNAARRPASLESLGLGAAPSRLTSLDPPCQQFRKKEQKGHCVTGARFTRKQSCTWPGGGVHTARPGCALGGTG